MAFLSPLYIFFITNFVRLIRNNEIGGRKTKIMVEKVFIIFKKFQNKYSRPRLQLNRGGVSRSEFNSLFKQQG